MTLMKNVTNNTYILLLVILVLMFSQACSTKQPEPAPFLSSNDVLENYAFKTEIVQREEKLPEDSVKSASDGEGSELLIQLAMLYSHRNNPNPDFTKALQYFHEYALIEDQVSVEYTEALLNYIAENKLAYDSLNNKYDKLRKEKKELEKSYSRLGSKIRTKDQGLQEKERIIQGNRQEIKEKNEIIEKLKRLDIQLEKRRVE